jgi:Tol biopolymer transport system component
VNRTVSTMTALVLAAGVGACSRSESPTTDASAPTVTSAAPSTPGSDMECEPLPALPTGRIAYTQTREDGTAALFLMKPDGTDRRCLVDTAGADSSPGWSPDGRWLAFIGGTVEGEDDVFVIRADGTRLRRVTRTEASESRPIWSPDGTRMAYTAEAGVDGASSIHVVARDGSSDRVVIRASGGVGHPELADWAPHAETLLFGAYERRTGLWTARTDGTHRRFLHGGPGDFGSGAVYSPDGRSLVFQADVDGGCIYRSDAAVRHVIRLTRGCQEGFDLSWSPDGRWIVWAGGAHGPADAHVMRSDGTHAHTIADGADVGSVDWQPARSQ